MNVEHLAEVQGISVKKTPLRRIGKMKKYRLTQQDAGILPLTHF